MAKHRGGLTVYDKQDMVISQFERINRNEQYRKEPTWFEQQVIDSKQRTEDYKTRMAKTPPQPRISHYNPINPLNGFNGKSESERIAITARLKQQQKDAKAAAKLELNK